MKKLLSTLFVLVVLSACAEQPTTNNDSAASDQKARADKAQRELSSGVQH